MIPLWRDVAALNVLMLVRWCGSAAVRWKYKGTLSLRPLIWLMDADYIHLLTHPEVEKILR